ncbi:hypothetical protein HHI36_006690 [Cryptolaemus montrouzieri]|uniref:Uncharacterized protein n=1 Tax=Cryptolaemus montrouzieri TaxID=559131 RepID=A0ABD2NXW8_9CUCU
MMEMKKNFHISGSEQFSTSILEPSHRKTSAEIINEARHAIRETQAPPDNISSHLPIHPIQTQRPFTPRDKERHLFGSKSRTVNRPPSSFRKFNSNNPKDIDEIQKLLWDDEDDQGQEEFGDGSDTDAEDNVETREENSETEQSDTSDEEDEIEIQIFKKIRLTTWDEIRRQNGSLALFLKVVVKHTTSLRGCQAL